MDYFTISVLKSLAFIAIFMIASWFIPKSLHFWELWKKTKRTVYLTNVAAFIMGAFFLYALDFMIMIIGLMGWSC